VRDGKNLRVVFELKADVEPTVVDVLSGQVRQLQVELVKKSPAKVKAVKAEPVVPVAPKAVAMLPPTETKPLAAVSLKPKGREIVVAIDAGHGGKDVGAQGANGTQEKDVVFAIAKRLEGLVNEQPGMRAVMIRKGDYFVKLRERVALAKQANADLLVSIHADAFNDASAHGASVYTLANKGASSSGARFLANSENAADGYASGSDRDDTLSTVLMDLSKSAAKEVSQNIGNKVLKQVHVVSHLHRTTVQKAGFVVLKSGDIPSILVETAFISNPEEEQRLNSRAYQDKMAAALMNGIVAHFKQYAPADTLMAQMTKRGRMPLLAAREPVQATVATSVAKQDAPLLLAAKKSRHVINPGETLSAIALQYGVSMRAIRAANEMPDGAIKVGQVLQIPQNS
jgi:N-acetylmuramoyl-L-alanine amidase